MSRVRAARVLVTDGQQRSALAVVRSLGHAGHTCFVTAPSLPALAARSRYCRKAFAVPRSSLDEEADRLLEIVDAEGIDLVIPTTDDAMVCVTSRYPGGRIGTASVAAPRPEAYRALSDKVELLEHGARVGLSVPRTRVADDRTTLRDVIREIGFPCVVKPHRSVVVHDDGGARHHYVRFAAEPAAVDGLLDELGDAAFPMLVQERIVGPAEGLFLMTDGAGRVCASFAHRRLREHPPAGGASTYRESVPVDPELLELGARLLHSVGWRGVAMIEFKRSAETGVPYLIEVNGRFWGSLQLAIDAGIDFPRLLAEMTLEDLCGASQSYQVGVRTRWFWGDMEYLWARLSTSPAELDLPPDEAARTRWSVLLEVLRFRWSDHLEALRLSDPLPFFHELRHWGQRLGRRLSS